MGDDCTMAMHFEFVFYTGAPSKHTAGSSNMNSPCNGSTVKALSHAGKFTRADSPEFAGVATVAIILQRLHNNP